MTPRTTSREHDVDASIQDEPVPASAALVVAASLPAHGPAERVYRIELDPNVAEDDAPPVSLCGGCGGPSPLCGGSCTAHAWDLAEMIWLAKLRATYLGLVVQAGPATRYGGVLLRVARALPAPAPRSLVAIGAAAHPLAEGVEGDPNNLAVRYIREGDVDALSDLGRVLRRGRARWLHQCWVALDAAALTSPLARLEESRDAARARRDEPVLVALICDGCARPSATPWDRLREVRGYDDAIRCPACDQIHEHPLPAVKVAFPHPVSRCVASGKRCMAHGGAPTDVFGICARGHDAIGDVAEALREIGEPGTPEERALALAVMRARTWMLETELDDAQVARAIMNSPALRPYLIAAATVDDDVRATFEKVTGERFDASSAEPGLVSLFAGGVSSLLAQGEALFNRFLEGVFGRQAKDAPRALPRTDSPRERRLRRKTH